MTVEPTRASWITRAEDEIRRLEDVEEVNIQADGDDIREVHILTSSHRPPKQIVRNVQSLFLTKLKRPIDHRLVSVAVWGKEDEKPQVREPVPERAQAPVPASAPSTATPPVVEPTRETDDRIRFGNSNVYISGARVQAQVELRWKGVPRMGSASGWSTRDGSNHLIAQATLGAVQEFLEGEVALSLEGLDFIRIGRRQVVAVALELLAYREQKSLVGCCAVEQDAQQAVVLATLSAINRVIGGLETREPTEYVLRPTSAWKESEAK